MRLLSRREALFAPAPLTIYHLPDHLPGGRHVKQPMQDPAQAASPDNSPLMAEGPRRALWWDERAALLRLLDQTLLPGRCEVLACAEIDAVAEAVRTLRVRGAPAIGVAAAYGLALGARAMLPAEALLDPEAVLAQLGDLAARLRATRPTAVNLAWALDRLLAVADSHLAAGNAVSDLP